MNEPARNSGPLEPERVTPEGDLTSPPQTRDGPGRSVERYFAYGSNLTLSRLQQRVPGARPLGAARLPGHRFGFDKAGRDGSGKANVRTAGADDEVWGVVYALEADDWEVLDGFEPGYERVRVRVETAGAEWLLASTYRAERRTQDLVPLEEYKRFVVDGAREHGLPDEWIAFLEIIPSRS